MELRQTADDKGMTARTSPTAADLGFEGELPPSLRRVEYGALRVGKTRVSLDSVIYAANEGASPDEIVDRFPTLDVQLVGDVITFYRSQRREVDEYLIRREQEAAELKAEIQKRFPPDGIRERLLARQAAKSKS